MSETCHLKTLVHEKVHQLARKLFDVFPERYVQTPRGKSQN